MGTFGILQKALKKLKTENGWIVIPENFADYGTDYKTRAGIALIGLGGIWRQDVVYPTAFMDGDGKPLDGANRYVLHFDEGQTPPANATWSVSMYDPQGYYVPNAIDRYNVAPWMPLAYNADGSLDIYIQAASPGEEKESNWLPAPASGPFNLTVRIYWPTDAVLDGTYKLPPVRTAAMSSAVNVDTGRRMRGVIRLDHHAAVPDEGCHDHDQGIRRHAAPPVLRDLPDRGLGDPPEAEGGRLQHHRAELPRRPARLVPRRAGEQAGSRGVQEASTRWWPPTSTSPGSGSTTTSRCRWGRCASSTASRATGWVSA